MSFTLALQLMRSLGKTQLGGVNISTLLPQKLTLEESQLPGYNIINDTYFYNQTTAQLFQINTNLVGGTQTLIGAAT